MPPDQAIKSGQSSHACCLEISPFKAILTAKVSASVQEALHLFKCVSTLDVVDIIGSLQDSWHNFCSVDPLDLDKKGCELCFLTLRVDMHRDCFPIDTGMAYKCPRSRLLATPTWKGKCSRSALRTALTCLPPCYILWKYIIHSFIHLNECYLGSGPSLGTYRRNQLSPG